MSLYEEKPAEEPESVCISFTLSRRLVGFPDMQYFSLTLESRRRRRRRVQLLMMPLVKAKTYPRKPRTSLKVLTERRLPRWQKEMLRP